METTSHALREQLTQLETYLQQLRTYADRPLRELREDLGATWALERGVEVTLACGLQVCELLAADAGAASGSAETPLRRLRSAGLLTAGASIVLEAAVSELDAVKADRLTSDAHWAFGVLQPLLPALQEVAVGAAAHLAAPGPTAQRTCLEEQLAAGPVKVRQRAAAALVKLAHPDSIPALLAALSDPDATVRRWSMDALRALGPAGNRALCAVLMSPYWEVRQGAAEGLLRSAGVESVGPLCSALENSDLVVRNHATATLERLGAAAVPWLEDSLKSATQDARSHIIPILAAIGRGGAVAVLTRVAETDPAETLRRAALRALGAVSEPRAAAELLDLCREPHRPQADVATVALARMGTAAVPALCEGLQSPHLSIRRQAALLLEAAPHPNAVGPLRESLQDPSAEVRALAATALGACGDSDDVESLSELLKDRNVTVRIAAAGALGRVALREPSLSLRQALPLLRRQLPPWSFGDANLQATVRNAIQHIEAATEGLKDLPVPAGRPQLDPASLPRPAPPDARREP